MSRAATLFGLAALMSCFAVHTGEGHAARRASRPLPSEKAKRDAASKRRNKAKKGGRK